MKKILFLLLGAFGCAKGAFAVNQPTRVEEITYDWLVDYGKLTTQTDHVQIFHKIFHSIKVKTLLEFGMSYGTKYFLDSCNKVISVEFVTNGCGPDWMKKCMALFQGYSNWIPIAYFSSWPGDMSWAPYRYIGSDKVYKAASYQNATMKHYALIDDLYLIELNAFLSNLSKSNTIDVAFIDCFGAYIRGDLVQLLFRKVPVILAHGCNRTLGIKDDVFGYSRIEAPEEYEEIYLPYGQGTTIWILKNEKYERFLAEMKRYAETL